MSETTKRSQTRHVWLINHYASRPGEPAIRHYSLAKHLLDHGWTTSIIACSTQHYSGKQRIHGKRWRSTEQIEGIQYRWLRMPRYGQNSLLRILNMIGFAAFTLLPTSTHGLRKPDAIIGSTVHPLAAWAALRLSRRLSAPFIFEIRDLWPETLVELGALRRRSVVAKMLYALELHLCNAASAIVVTMPFGEEYLESRGVSTKKVVWISNGVNTQAFKPPEATTHDDDSFHFGYFGALGQANNMEPILRGFAAAAVPNATLTVMGNGPKKQSLIHLAAQLDLEDEVNFPDPIPQTEIPKFVASIDCNVLALQDSPLYTYGMSLNKLFEYMASGKPVLFAGKARGNPIEHTGGGICVAPDVNDIAAGMRAIASTSLEVRQRMGAQNRSYANEHFDFAELARRMADTLNAVIND